MATRVFMVIGTAVAIVIVTEEFPAAHRGWAIGRDGRLVGERLRAGRAVLLADRPPAYGWRTLYFAWASCRCSCLPSVQPRRAGDAAIHRRARETS
jgi:hypothetical protein